MLYNIAFIFTALLSLSFALMPRGQNLRSLYVVRLDLRTTLLVVRAHAARAPLFGLSRKGGKGHLRGFAP